MRNIKDKQCPSSGDCLSFTGNRLVNYLDTFRCIVLLVRIGLKSSVRISGLQIPKKIRQANLFNTLETKIMQLGVGNYAALSWTPSMLGHGLQALRGHNLQAIGGHGFQALRCMLVRVCNLSGVNIRFIINNYLVAGAKG